VRVAQTVMQQYGYADEARHSSSPTDHDCHPLLETMRYAEGIERANRYQQANEMTEEKN
jgi:hypothetical protein